MQTPQQPLKLTKELWNEFADEYAVECRDDEGFIRCQCRWNCGRYAEKPDLHHIRSRSEAPHLYFVKSNLAWLIRTHHQREHNFVKPRNLWSGPTLAELRRPRRMEP